METVGSEPHSGSSTVWSGSLMSPLGTVLGQFRRRMLCAMSPIVADTVSKVIADYAFGVCRIRAAHAAQRSKRLSRASAYSTALRAGLGCRIPLSGFDVFKI